MKRARTSGTDVVLPENMAAHEAGEYLRAAKRSKTGLPDIDDGSFAPKPNVLSKFTDKGTVLKRDDLINDAYRRAWKGMDELFSTALTREVVKGFFSGTAPTIAELKVFSEYIDVLSSLRMTTGLSGFSTSYGVMQHPTGTRAQFFADPAATASEHSQMDTARRRYVENAMLLSARGGRTAEAVVIAGARAAIEFTLNYFTAPITADNVFKFSKRSQMSAADRAKDTLEQHQLAERERLKRIYEKLGGTLRKLPSKETADQSRTRKWQFKLNFDSVRRDYPEAPPSPRRSPDLDDWNLKTYGLKRATH